MILLDTNLLARSIQTGHIHYSPAINAMIHERSQNGEVLVIAPQTIIEFYAISTRPANGVGLTPEQALSEIDGIKKTYPLLPETPEIFTRWEQLVAKHKPRNRHVFDLRLVAFMLTHQINKILTFNDKDFVQFTEIRVLNPFDVLSIPRV